VTVFTHDSRPIQTPRRRAAAQDSQPTAVERAIAVPVIVGVVVAIALALIWVLPKIHCLVVAGLFALGLFKSDVRYGIEFSDAPFFAGLLMAVAIVAGIVATAAMASSTEGKS
jgi:hypothetical protein